jgi:3-carboxy-cis,cis-muconate cycloisomerase
MIGVFEHPWLQGLFGDAEAAAIWAPDQQLQHMLAFEAAFTRALGQAGRIPQVQADSVALQIAAFKPELASLRRGTAQDGLPVPALVAQLVQATGAKTAVHQGATSQDVIDTALALTLRNFNSLLEVRLAAVAGGLDQLAAKFGPRMIMGRTRMQAALPVTVADRLVAWSQPLAGHRDRLQGLRPKVELLQLGGAVGNTAALAPQAQTISADMAKRLGLGNPPRAWHAMRENLVEYAGLLALISGSLGKMGQDICLMAQQGVDEIAMSGGGSSSAMAHKQNPVLAELLVTLARFNATQIAGMQHSMIHEQERSGAAWGLEWMILPQMAQAVARSLSAANEICTSITRIGA